MLIRMYVVFVEKRGLFRVLVPFFTLQESRLFLGRFLRRQKEVELILSFRTCPLLLIFCRKPMILLPVCQQGL